MKIVKRLLASFLVVAVGLLSVMPLVSVEAAELTNRSVTISTAIPAAQGSHLFTFSINNTNPIGSIAFEYCDNSPLVTVVCNAPSGLSLLSAILTSQTNNTGFSIDILGSTANKVILTRVAAAATSGVSSYTFNGVVNSNIPNQTIFVRIATYATTDASGPATDNGSVAYAIVGAFSIGGFVPPYLIFCAAATVSLDCSTINGSLLSFGELLTNQANTATSQFSGATNDPAGYSVSIIGQTMTAGNQIIPSLAVQTGSLVGQSQFGINLRQNGVPSVGAEPVGVGSALPNASYNTPNLFRFVNGDQLVNSTLPTDYNLMTVSYVVNVSSSQAPGYYATTLTYVATAAF